MKHYITVIITLLMANFSLGQDGQVVIEQDPKLKELMKIYQSVKEQSELYRIQVYFGSHNGAQNTMDQVTIDFPDWPSKIDFESPSYRVRIGRFKNKLDAERNLIEVRKKYPGAMLLKPEKRG